MFFLHPLARPRPHSFREIDAEYPAFRSNGGCQLRQATPGSVADLKNTFPRGQGKLFKSGLTDRPFTVFGQEVVDAADLVIKSAGLVLRLEHTKHTALTLLRFAGSHNAASGPS